VFVVVQMHHANAWPQQHLWLWLCCFAQYALDYYPPFASGCGFILSRDLVQALLKQPLPDYRLLVGGRGAFAGQ
jgi:hypothetical protein